MGNVTKKDLVEEIAARTGLTQVDTKIVLESLLETISNFLCNGRNIEIRGFGRFKVKKKKGRVARNPRTGEVVVVKEGLKPVFEASKDLKNALLDKIAKGRGAASADSDEEESSSDQKKASDSTDVL